MRRLALVVAVLVIGGVLGLAVAGVPRRAHDRPLAFRTETSVAVTTTTAEVHVKGTTVDPPTTVLQTTTTAVPPSTTRPAGSVKVQVANVSGVDGAGARVSDKIRAGGYQVLPAASPNRTPAQDISRVLARDGFGLDASQVANILGVPGTAVEPMAGPPFRCVPACDQMDVLIVLGRDVAKRL